MLSLMSANRRLHDWGFHIMNKSDTLRPFRTGAFDFASCARLLRLFSSQLTTVLAERMFMVYPPRPIATVEAPTGLNGSWCANWGTAGRATKHISITGSALLIGAAVTLGGTQTVGAGTLVFTFSDDGETSTVTPSGSLDLSSYSTRRDASESATSTIRINSPTWTNPVRGEYWEFGISSSTTSKGFTVPSWSVSGFSSYDGGKVVDIGNSYDSELYFYLGAAHLRALYASNNSVSNGVVDFGDKKVTFDDTLSNVLGDNEFHIELGFDSHKIIYTTSSTAPVMPEDFVAAAGDGQVALNWSDPNMSSITKYEIQQKSGDGEYGEWEPIEGSGATTTSHTVEGLTNFNSYAFRIRAVNFIGNGAASDEVEATPLPEGLPKAAELSVVSTEEAGQVVLSWTFADDPSITGWQLQQREGDAAFGDEWTAIDPSDAATRNHTIDGLSSEVAYGFRIRAVNAIGNGLVSNTETVTPKAPEPEPTGPTVEAEKQVLTRSLAAAGQATLAGVTNLIDQRLQSTPGTSALVLGGQTVAATGSSMNPATSQETDGWRSGSQNPESFNRPVGDADLLDGSAFTLSLSEEDGSDRGWTIWGHGDLQRFEGKSGEDSWDGSVKSAVLGFDTRTNGNLLAGLAVSSSRSKMDLVTEEVGSRVETSLTAAWPYMQMALPSGTGTVQIVLGIGSGDAEHQSEDGDAESAGLSMTAASVSARWAVAQQGQMALSVPVKAEVVQLKTDGDGTTAISGLSIKSWRASGGVEAAHSGVSLDSSWVLTPRGSVSFRWDGGDGVTGKGIEVGGGFGLHAPDSRVSLNASGRWLATHSDDNQKEWGASVGVQIAPDARGRGWSASLRQEWGLQQVGLLSGDGLFQDGSSGIVSSPRFTGGTCRLWFRTDGGPDDALCRCTIGDWRRGSAALRSRCGICAAGRPHCLTEG